MHMNDKRWWISFELLQDVCLRDYYDLRQHKSFIVGCSDAVMQYPNQGFETTYHMVETVQPA